MYTQCPECAMSFRVTASILKQAGGKVRCGGCRNAFNALDFLSETKPEEPPQDDPSAALPELTPDPLDDDGVAVPKVMSPEQSAALLKTLDELAGDDIRLEDTGIEWRLLSDDEADDDESANDDAPSDADASQVDELLEVAPTEVDELLTASPSQVDAAELFDGSASIVESTEVFGGGDTEVDAADVFADATGNELRFDDNTGLPEDFDGDRAARTPRSAEPRPQIIEPRAHQETQVDIVFGEPDEWGELLDEVETVDDAMAADVPPPDLSEAIIEPEPSPGDSGMTLAQELDALDEGDSPLDIDTQFNLQAEALGIDTTGVHEDVAGEALEPDEPEGDDTSIDDDLIAAAFETEQAADDDESIPDSAESPEPEPAEAQVPAGDEDTDDDAPSDDVLAEIDIDTAVAAGAAADAGDESDDEATPDGRSGDESDDESDDASGDDAVAAEIVVSPESDVGQSIDREADQDPIAIDTDGGSDDDADDDTADETDVAAAFSGGDVETIIMEGDFVRTALEQEALEAQRAADAEKENGEDDDEEAGFIAAAKRTFRGRFAEEATPRQRSYGLFAGVAVLLLALGGQLVHQSRAELATIPALNNLIAPLYRAIGAPITPNWDVTGWRFEVTREQLSGAATIDAGDDVPEEIPVDPDAVDIVADDAPTEVEAVAEPEVLTIYSRIGNKSSQALPYPLISVSLTDRFEETIGSKVFEPREYLPQNADVDRLVPAGNTFNAVISIESPSMDATGYKLNVCYRQDGPRLRCAIADFK